MSAKSTRPTADPLRRSAVEELAEEARWMAGNPGDHVARAVAYYHLYAHSGGRHLVGLLAAEDTLALAALLKRMKAVAMARWPWERAEAVQARIAAFAEVGSALRRIDAERCADMVFAYRLAATERLRAAGASRLGTARVEALAGGDAIGIEQAEAAAAPAERRPDALLAMADRLPGKTLQKLGRQAAGCLASDRAAIERAIRAGPERIAQRLRRDGEMPRLFHENPGQAYYEMLNAQAGKRREEKARLDPMLFEDDVVVVD